MSNRWLIWPRVVNTLYMYHIISLATTLFLHSYGHPLRMKKVCLRELSDRDLCEGANLMH